MKLDKKDFELNEYFCRPKKHFKERQEFLKAGIQILSDLVSPKDLLEHRECVWLS